MYFCSSVGFTTIGTRAVDSEAGGFEELENAQNRLENLIRFESQKREATEIKLQQQIIGLSTGLISKFEHISKILDTIQLQLINMTKGKGDLEVEKEYPGGEFTGSGNMMKEKTSDAVVDSKLDRVDIELGDVMDLGLEENGLLEEPLIGSKSEMGVNSLDTVVGLDASIDLEDLVAQAPERRDNGITINTAVIETEGRYYACADYVKNLIIDVAQTNRVILVFSDTDGSMHETKEHTMLAKLVGDCFLNKQDRLNDNQLLKLMELEDSLKKTILNFLIAKGLKTELKLGFRKLAISMIVGVNEEGDTTFLGKLVNRLINEGTKALLKATYTLRTTAIDQLEVWVEKTGCEVVVTEKENAKTSLDLSLAVRGGKEQGFDVVLCDTCRHLYTNYSLVDELIVCKRAIGKFVYGATNEILQVLDRITNVYILPQAREFYDEVLSTCLILTKLDGSASGSCMVSAIDELGASVKLIGVQEGIGDLQSLDDKTLDFGNGSDKRSWSYSSRHGCISSNNQHERLSNFE